MRYLEDDDSEDLSDRELQVTVMARGMKGKKAKRSGVGSLVMKKYGKEWHYGTVTEQEKKGLSRVKFENASDDELTDTDLAVSIAAHELLAAKTVDTSSRKKKKAKSARTNEFKLPAPGTLVRQRFTEDGKGAWVNGKITRYNKGKAWVDWDDDTADYLADDEDVRLAVAAYESHCKSRKPEVPSNGTGVRKRFEKTWYNGKIIGQRREGKQMLSDILYEDGDEETLSEEETRVCAAARVYHDQEPLGR